MAIDICKSKQQPDFVGYNSLHKKVALNRRVTTMCVQAKTIMLLFVTVAECRLNPDSLYITGGNVLSASGVHPPKLKRSSSEPFLKPKLSLFDVFISPFRKFTLFHRSRPEYSQKVSVLPSILKDHWSIDECRDAILRWADKLHHLELKTENKEGSVCAAEDVRCVLEDLDKQWKRGQLPNMQVGIPLVCDKQRRHYLGWGC
ncbi:uncharacterized protein LOC143100076 [Alosa pseudoharengus]|uniref:uncharacterized protein LOC143100076 n=1 Tax=Alosa pseudoharengus TaxID=34774 RepID=UPI003F8B8BD8